MKIIITCMFLIACAIGYSQQGFNERQQILGYVDDLFTYENVEDSIIHYLNNLKSNFEDQSGYIELLKGSLAIHQRDSIGINHIQNAIQSAQNKNDTTLLSYANFYKGYYYRAVKKDSDSAVYHFERSLLLGQELDLYFIIIQSYKMLSFEEMALANFSKALEYLLTARPIINEYGSIDEKGTLLNNLGHAYMKLGLPNEALKMFEEDLMLMGSDGNSLDLIVSHLNQVEAKLQLMDAKGAISKLATVRPILFELKLNHNSLQYYNYNYYLLLGEALRLNGQFSEAIEAYDMSMTIYHSAKAKNVKSILGKHFTYLALGDTLVAHQILNVLKDSHDNSRARSLTSLRLTKAFANSYYWIKDYENAANFYNAYIARDEEINDKGILSEYIIKDINQRLDKEKLDKELIDAQVKSERQFKYIFILIAIIISGAMVFFLLKNQQSKRHKLEISVKNNQLQIQNEQLTKSETILSEANAKLSFLNEDLEKKVKEKITSLEKKNKMIDTYSFMNSHKLRSPVASIKGIAALFPKVSKKEQETLMGYLAAEINRLDDTVREIQQSLNQE